MTNPSSRTFFQETDPTVATFKAATQHAKDQGDLAQTARTDLTNQVSTMNASQQAALVSITAQLRLSAQATGTVPIVQRPPATEMFSVPQFTAGSIEGQRGFHILTGTATMDNTGVLTVDSDYNTANNKGVVTPYTVGEGIWRYYIPGPESKWMSSWGGQPGAGQHYNVWAYNGNIELGYITTNQGSGISNPISAGTTPIPNGPYCVEIRMGPAYAGSSYNARVYAADAAVPVNPQLSVSIGNGAAPILPEGPLVLGSLNGTGKFSGFVVDDWKTGPNRIQAKTTLYGPWEPRLEGNTMTMTTITTGALARSDVSGTPGVALLMAVPPNQPYRPVIATRYREIGGTTWSDFVRTASNTAGAAGSIQRTDVITGLDPARNYEVDIEFNLDENEPGYVQGVGACLVDLVVADGGSIRPTPYGGETYLIVADSIGAGDVAGGYDSPPNPVSTPRVTYTEEAFCNIACDTVGGIPIKATYGGTGLAVSGSGGMPPTLTNLQLFMQGRALRNFSPRDPTKIYIQIGTNDIGGANRNPPVPVSGALFTAKYRELLLYLQARYPAAGICLGVPFNGAYKTETIAIGAEFKIPVVDTSSWADPATDFSAGDKTHPLRFPPGTDRGHRKLGRLLAAAWQAIGFAPAPVVRPKNPTIFETVPNSNFDVAVNGVTALPAAPAGAAGVIFSVVGGDITVSTDGTDPTGASVPYGQGSRLKITPLTDAVRFRALTKAAVPRLVGNWLRAVN